MCTVLISFCVSAEGRVENQKLNQTAALLSFGWVFGFQLDLLEKNLVSPADFTFSVFRASAFTLCSECSYPWLEIGNEIQKNWG